MLIVIFGVVYKIKGLKTAFIATGIAFVFSALAFVALMYALVNAMSN